MTSQRDEHRAVRVVEETGKPDRALSGPEFCGRSDMPVPWCDGGQVRLELLPPSYVVRPPTAALFAPRKLIDEDHAVLLHILGRVLANTRDRAALDNAD